MAAAGRAAGSVLGTAFGTLGLLRGTRPLHPHGVVYDAVVRRTGAPYAFGAAWLDQPGEDHGLVRLSRAAGLPEPLPDVHGLALTFTGEDGARHDLLLATTGMTGPTRFLLRPTWSARGVRYGSLLPYHAAGGLVLIAAVPVDAALAGSGEVFRLLAASPLGPWQPFGTLEMIAGGTTDRPIRFDPVRYVPPGLRWPEPLAQLRNPSYEAARWTPVTRVVPSDSGTRSGHPPRW
mgnify:CR=1 FL=1